MKRIKTLEQLNKLVMKGRAVIWRGVGPKPAAFMIGMPGKILLRFFKVGLYEYRRMARLKKISAREMAHRRRRDDPWI